MITKNEYTYNNIEGDIIVPQVVGHIAHLVYEKQPELLDILKTQITIAQCNDEFKLATAMACYNLDDKLPEGKTKVFWGEADIAYDTIVYQCWNSILNFIRLYVTSCIIDTTHHDYYIREAYNKFEQLININIISSKLVTSPNELPTSNM